MNFPESKSLTREEWKVLSQEEKWVYRVSPMNLEEKREIYTRKFPAIISKRMADQVDGSRVHFKQHEVHLLSHFCDYWDSKEGPDFWDDIILLYYEYAPIYHQQILDIFHKHQIKP